MTTTIQAAYCVDCEELHPIADLVDCNGEYRCEDCAKSNDWRECDDCGEWHDSSDLVDCNGSHYCEDCAESAGWFKCYSCDEWTNPDEQYAGPDNNDYCESCFGDKYIICYGCDSPVRNEDSVDCNGESRCESCARDDGWFECCSCNDWHHGDYHYMDPSGCDDYCESCFWEAYSTCEGCNETFDRDDLHYTESDGCSYCEDCLPSAGEDFHYSGFRNRDGRTTCIGSERCFGVELETDECDGYDHLDYNSTSGAWGAKYDATCNGKEFYSDILSGDAGLAAVAELTDLADRNRWHAGSGCGYHLHLDMRAECDDSLYAAAYAYRATEMLWHGFVEDFRNGNSYTHTANWSCDDLDNYTAEGARFSEFVSNKVRGRYNWINLAAYHAHTTFEVRLHHASLDDVEICNWIKANTRFTDWACSLGYEGLRDKLVGKTPDEQFEIIASEAWQDDDLRNYYAEKSGRAVKAEVAA